MEKLSGILPSSPRIQSTDTSRSLPARPGAPVFGRTEGKNSLGAAKAAFSEIAQQRAAEGIDSNVRTPEAALYKKNPEVAGAKIASDLAQKFFKGVQEDIRGDESLSDEIINRFEEATPETQL